MKLFLSSLVLLCSINLFAALNETTFAYEKDSAYTLEPAFTFSSINGGSQFVSVGLTARLTSWLRVGAEGEVPANFDERAQIYSARLLARIPLLDQVNKVFVQASTSVSFFNGGNQEALENVEGIIPESTYFNNYELLAGYSRTLAGQWSLGAMLGIQYSNIDTYVFNDFGSRGSVFNRASIMGSYVF